jgi:hypothetical protein
VASNSKSKRALSPQRQTSDGADCAEPKGPDKNNLVFEALPPSDASWVAMKIPYLILFSSYTGSRAIDWKAVLSGFKLRIKASVRFLRKYHRSATWVACGAPCRPVDGGTGSVPRDNHHLRLVF